SMWRYALASKQWEFVGGPTTINNAGSYGALGDASNSYMPSGGGSAACWTVLDGNCWLYGGRGGSATGLDETLSDLWKYKPDTSEWTRVGGSNAGNQVAVYGTRSTPAPTNSPGGRYYAHVWTDKNGDFWMFGGEWYSENPPPVGQVI